MGLIYGLSYLVLDSQFGQNIGHQTPIGEGWLKQIGSHKYGKPNPVGVYKMGKGNAS